MRASVPRHLIVGTAVAFSAYVVLLGFSALGVASSPGPMIVGSSLFAVATALALTRGRAPRLPLWVAIVDLVIAVALPLIVDTALDPDRAGGNGYATWYVAGIGALMTILATRGRPAFAWLGILALVVQTIVWSGPGALIAFGVGGSIAWVAVAHVLARAMNRTMRDARRFTLAEQEAAGWQAAQEAHVFERQFRLGQTSSMALAMLRRIEQSGGDLTVQEREECLHLESAIRDEIRGRRLLNDEVRAEVMAARRRGTAVTLLDEGGLDELGDRELARVLARLARAIRETDAETIIVRTVPEGTETAITFVALRSVQSEADDEVVAFFEISRTGLLEA